MLEKIHLGDKRETFVFKTGGPVLPVSCVHKPGCIMKQFQNHLQILISRAHQLAWVVCNCTKR